MNNFKLYEVDHVRNLKELVYNSTKKFGEKDAYRIKSGDGYKSITFNQCKKDIDALGTALLAAGLKDQNIAIVGETCYEWVISYLAVTIGIGAIVPIDKELKEKDILDQIIRSDSTAIIYTDSYKDIIEKNKSLLHNVKLFIDMNAEKDFSEEIISWKHLITKGAKFIADGNNSFINAEIDENKLAAILFTSGTTGDSKGVMLSHKNITSDIIAGSQMFVYSSDSVLLSILPIYHSYEMNINILFAFFQGVTMCFNDKLINLTKNFLIFRPTSMNVVPLIAEKMYHLIWNEAKKKGKVKVLKRALKLSNILLKFKIDIRRILFKDIHKFFGGRLRTMMCGGAYLDKEVVKGFREFGIFLMQGYGITECSPLVTTNRIKYYNDKAVGLVVPCCEVKVDNPNSNGEGEILVKGSNVMIGYYKNEEATKEAFKGEWFKTGDLGFLDRQGFLHISGRVKNLIILRNGENVCPEEIESYLLKSECIKEVIISGDEANDKIIAAVYPDYEYLEGKSKDQIYEIIKSEIYDINKQLPQYKRVHSIKIRDTEFIKTTTKKIKRFQI